MKTPCLSPEGIAWRDYRWLNLLAAIPFSLAIDGLYWGPVSLTARRRFKGLMELPPNAIIFSSHREMHVIAIGGSVLDRPEPGAVALGYHGWLSYVFSITRCFYRRWHQFRYQKDSDIMPLEQILHFLKENPRTRLVLFMDSGGPYGVVRDTLVRLALGSNRPLVALRHEVSRYFVLKEHVMPLPFCEIRPVFSTIVRPEELKALPRRQARGRLQELLDDLYAA